MESNITNRQHFDGDAPLAEPHFDEEATLLSARPVVPLQEIKAEERSGKRLAFGVAMVFSLLVGALGATLIYKQRGQKQATAIVSTAVPGVEGIAVDEPDGSVSENAPDVATGNLQEADATASPDEALGSLASGSSSVETSRGRQGALRRAERNESRRLKRESAREAQKEARGHRSKSSSDDLLRIREIFEGSPRP